ncbi:MAG: hypothetical protein H8E87_05935 [FCB group bacterium]|nr:hypothetical protein [FCB group bacterium]
MSDVEYEASKEKIIEYLKNMSGKGVDTTANIGKATGLNRREASKILNRMEMEGLIQAAGVMAGVAGYKLKS